MGERGRCYIVALGELTVLLNADADGDGNNIDDGVVLVATEDEDCMPLCIHSWIDDRSGLSEVKVRSAVFLADNVL